MNFSLPREGVAQAPARLAGGEVARRVALVAGFALLTALGAQVRIRLPFTPVPITLQTFFVLLGGLTLGGGLGAGAQVLYLVLGALGVPVFAGGALGFASLVGPTGGYLVGFVLGAWLVGQLARGVDPRDPRAELRVLGILAVGTVIIYVSGAYWLARVMGLGLRPALAAGVLPFVPGDTLKAVLVVWVWSRLGGRGGAR